MRSGFVIDPKQDITAFELPHITMIVQTTRDYGEIRSYIKDKCPSAIRHIPGWDWSDKELIEIERRNRTSIDLGPPL